MLLLTFILILWAEEEFSDSWSYDKKAKYYNLEVVKDHVETLGSVDERDGNNKNGYDMLNYAIYSGNLSVVSYLIEHGCDINHADDDGITPLMDAILGENRPIISYLVNKGADLNIESKEKQTALLYAQATQDMNTTRLLVDKGAKIDHKNSLGQTALILAAKQGNLPIVKYLVSKDASIDFDLKEIEDSYNWVSNEKRDKVINYLTALKISRSIKPPTLAFVDTPKSVTKERVNIKLKITDEGSGIGNVHLFINGSEVFANEQRALKKKRPKPAANEKPFVIKSYNIAVQQGLNEIKAYVYDKNNTMQSDNYFFSMVGDYEYDGKPTLHAVVIGIDKFSDASLNLSYASADATLFGTTLFKRAKKIFKKVNIHYLREPQTTTKEAISSLLSRLQNISANDFFVFYSASHGIIIDNTFYLVTANVAKADDAVIQKEALSQTDLREHFKRIPTANKLLIFDTCYSGLVNEEISKKLAQSSVRKLNLTSISAAQSKQTALEGYADGHGVFSYVLSEAMEGEADYNGDGMVQSMELVQYAKTEVPKAAREYNHEQYPAYFQSGQIFTVTKLRDYKGKVNLKPQYFKYEEIKQIAKAMEKKDTKAINEVVKANQEKTQKVIVIVKEKAKEEAIKAPKKEEPVKKEEAPKREVKKESKPAKKVKVGDIKLNITDDTIFLPTQDRLIKHFSFTNAKKEHLLVLDFDSIYFKKHMISQINSPHIVKIKVGWHDVSYRITIQLKEALKYQLSQEGKGVRIKFLLPKGK